MPDVPDDPNAIYERIECMAIVVELATNAPVDSLDRCVVCSQYWPCHEERCIVGRARGLIGIDL